MSIKSSGSLAPHIDERRCLNDSLSLHAPSKARSNSNNPSVAIGMQADAYELFMNEEATIEVGSLILLLGSVMRCTTTFKSEQNRS